MRSYFRCLVIMLLNVAVQTVEAKNIKVAIGLDRPPYIYQEDGKWKGIEVELIGEIFRRLGYKIHMDNMSTLRLDAESRHGNSYDVVVGVPLGSEGAVFYSEPYVSFENYAFALKKKSLHIKSAKDLSSVRVGAWINAWRDLGPSFKSAFGPHANGSFGHNYKEFIKSEDQSLAFWQDKVDAIVMDRNIFAWYRMTLASRVDTAKDVEVFRIFPAKHSAFVAFKKKDLREAFDGELEKLRSSGEYDRIVRSYVGESLANFKEFKNQVR